MSEEGTKMLQKKNDCKKVEEEWIMEKGEEIELIMRGIMDYLHQIFLKIM